jgi:membrane-bound serine protease (ClpP class)
LPDFSCRPSAGSRAEGIATIQVKARSGPRPPAYIARAVHVAAERKAECLVVQLDTPGGLLDSTKEIVDTFYASPLPVVVYVAPSGANAGSAGVFITMAADCRGDGAQYRASVLRIPFPWDPAARKRVTT